MDVQFLLSNLRINMSAAVQLNDVQLTSKLGAGAFGQVMLVRRLSRSICFDLNCQGRVQGTLRGRKLAVKTIATENEPKGSKFSHEAAVASLMLEAAALGVLQSQHIVGWSSSLVQWGVTYTGGVHDQVEFLGLVHSGDKVVGLLLELCDAGDIQSLLKSKNCSYQLKVHVSIHPSDASLICSLGIVPVG